jgi:hypothetical protein
VNVRYRAVSGPNHTLKVGGATYGRDGSEVCFRTSQRLIVHPRTDATNSGKRSTTNNVTSYTHWDFQRVWEGWEAALMAFHAFHTLSFPWPVFAESRSDGGLSGIVEGL